MYAEEYWNDKFDPVKAQQRIEQARLEEALLDD